MSAIAQIHLSFMVAICLTGWEAIEIVDCIDIILPRKSTTALADWNCCHSLICGNIFIFSSKMILIIFLLFLPLIISVTFITISFVDPHNIVSLRSRSPEPMCDFCSINKFSKNHKKNSYHMQKALHLDDL